MAMAAVPPVPSRRGPKIHGRASPVAGVEVRAGVASVVRLDGADRREQRPVETGAAPAGGLVGLRGAGGHGG